MEIMHVLSKQSSKPREDLLVPRVILEGHLLLYFAIVDLHRTKCPHRVSSVNGLSGFPEEMQNYMYNNGIIERSDTSTLYITSMNISTQTCFSRILIKGRAIAKCFRIRETM